MYKYQYISVNFHFFKYTVMKRLVFIKMLKSYFILLTLLGQYSCSIQTDPFDRAETHYTMCFPNFRTPTVSTFDPCNNKTHVTLFSRIKHANHFDRMVYFMFSTSTYQHARHFNLTICTLYEIMIDLLRKADQCTRPRVFF